MEITMEWIDIQSKLQYDVQWKSCDGILLTMQFANFRIPQVKIVEEIVFSGWETSLHTLNLNFKLIELSKSMIANCLSWNCITKNMYQDHFWEVEN